METTRRETIIGAAAIATLAAGASTAAATTAAGLPWYRTAKRWGQVNITEDDGNMDIGFWRQYWRDTDTQAMILNAGGVVAYYPTKIPYHRRALTLGDRDLFGELVKACRDDNIVCVARMTNLPTPELEKAHPEWMVQDVNGNRTHQGCMNGGFSREFISSIIKEIAATYKPAGFSVNGGGGLNYDLCYCQVCTPLFRQMTGKDLPRAKNWDDPVYREWVIWNEGQAMAMMNRYRADARSAGGPDCIWVGQNGGSLTARSMVGILSATPIAMHDHQARSDASGFQQNPEAGKLTHSILGWDRIAIEAQAIYGPRLTTKAAPEAQMWMYEGMAGGLSPWWHTISAHHHDKRRYATVPPVLHWAKANEVYLHDRTPVASVGLVWSEENNVFYGRDDVNGNVEAPWRGVVNALVRARIPFTVIHADRIDKDAAGLSALVLANLAAMTDAQVGAVRRFVSNGGGLFASGDTSLHDRFGDARPDYALADLFGAHWIAGTKPNTGYATPPAERRGGRAVAEVSGPAGTRGAAANERPVNVNTYVRFTPELRHNVAYSPHPGDEPLVPPGAVRHPILKGFDETDVIFFGGVVPRLRIAPGAQVLATFIPESPVLQAENAWWRTPKTDIQALIVNTTPNGSRIVFMPADMDRQYAADNLPDQGDLIANAIRWAARDRVPLEVQGKGLLDCNLYRQSRGMVLHMCNLVSSATWRAPLEEFIPVGPYKVRVKLDGGISGRTVRLLVSDQSVPATITGSWAEFVIPSISSHEVAVIS
ncbi:alpha-amylase family protein [Sphingomonas crusticola]|uniref:alpha-amylase family protein n=1 Tax=Sphingomonas crusticola TaxID=1697973 RepID=UPI000E2771AF|nr:alpha-amylase family protein [Sphingomonas crusticola]